jgi:hypothetical protein
VRTNNTRAISNAESQAETACKRLGYWHPPAEAP